MFVDLEGKMANIAPFFLGHPVHYLDLRSDFASSTRDPCIFLPHDKTSDVDPKGQKPSKKKAATGTGVSSILQSATMVLTTAVKGFGKGKSEKPSVSISEKVSIAEN